MRHRRNDNTPGDAHELTFSCYGRKPWLRSDRVCHWFLENLKVARKEHHFEVWAYVLMPEHVHLLVWPKSAPCDIACIRDAIKAPVGRQVIEHVSLYRKDWLPNMTRKRGRRTERLFWQSGGGYDRNVRNMKTLQAMIDYIHLNPVRRGLVERARDWPWSSAAAFEGGQSLLMPDPVDPAWADSASN